MKKRIYLDYASSTPVDKKVARVVFDALLNVSGNPGAVHFDGREAKSIIEKTRKNISNVFSCSSKEIFFTSGGTESNNLAIFGTHNLYKDVFEKNKKIPHIITSTIEHASVLEPIRELEKKGVKVTYLNPDENGIISPKSLRDSITPETFLISIHLANNEIGVIEPINDFSKEIRRFFKFNKNIIGRPAILHTDACQAINYIDLKMNSFHADLMTVDGSKIYGPKGIGFLFVKRGISIKPIIFGGGQESDIRSGSEPTALIAGLGEAINIVSKRRKKESERLLKLRDYFIKKLLSNFVGSSINGSMDSRLPNNVNIHIPKIDSEYAVIYLDEKGISASTGSTCLSNKENSYSYVISNIRGDKSFGESSIRFSLGVDSKKSDVDYCLKKLKDIQYLQWKISQNPN